MYSMSEVEMDRYSIVGSTPDEIANQGGQNISAMNNSNVVFASLTDQQAQALKKLGYRVEKVSRVSTADNVYKPKVAPPQPVQGPVPIFTPEDLIIATGFEEARGVTDPPLEGDEINVAVIDTGIRESHQLIKGRVVYRENYTASPMEDTFDHGTGVCSILVAIAPKCNVLNLKVLDSKGEGTIEEVVTAIDDCIDMWNLNMQYAPHFINLSIGSEDTNDLNDPLRLACRAAIDRGIWLNAAAGNNGPNPETIVSPACERYVITTGSLSLGANNLINISSFSSRGPTKGGLIKPDMAFFGENIIMASSASDTATKANSGTSFSTPFVTGLGALYQEGVRVFSGQIKYIQPVLGLNPSIVTLVSVQSLLDIYLPGICAKPVGTPYGKDNDYGNGLPYGPLFATALTTVPSQMNMSGLMSAMMIIPMIGMMSKTMRKPAEKVRVAVKR